MTEIIHNDFWEENLYIHPNDEEIGQLIKKLQIQNESLEKTVKKIFEWFDENITYSRLNAPFYPLQRSDLDVINMKSGTCGDYSNLLVSILLRLGYSAQYAYLTKDCYGNFQDHICVAVLCDDEWKLIDATLPYRKWMGFSCPHQEFELLSVQQFYKKMKEEERHWEDEAMKMGEAKYAGLLYAPWIYEEIIQNTDTVLETVFYLLAVNGVNDYQLYVSYLVYSKENAFSPIMCIVQDGIAKYRFSVNEASHIWDDAQWGEAYEGDSVPREFQTKRFAEMKRSIEKNLGNICEKITV